MHLANKQLSDLPTEIKEHILTMADGISLLRMRQVSKEWKKILDEPNLALTKRWKEVCLTEIDNDSLKKVLDKLDPKYYIYNKFDIWRIAYTHWHQWSCLPKWSFTQKLLHTLSFCEITSIVNSGDWLIISTRDRGSVFALHYEHDETELLYRGGNVIDVHPYAITEDKPLLSGFSHDKMILVFENLTRGDLNLHTLKMDYDEELTGRKQIFHFENKKIEINVSKDRSIITLKKNQEKEVRKIELLNHWSVEHCWFNGNLLASKKGHYIVFDDELMPVESHPFSYLPELHAKQKAIRYYLGASVIISVNMKQYINHEMVIQVLNKEKKYLPFADISVHFTCIVYYGLMLFAGTDIGSMFVYRTKHFLDLLHLELSNPCAVFQFGNDPLISIALQETSIKPIIWTASCNQIYQVAFF